MVPVNFLHKLYKDAIRNFPLLKYSGAFVVAIFILSLIAQVKLENSTVLIYTIATLVVCLLGFIFSILTRSKDKAIRGAFYILIYCIVISLCLSFLSFASFIFFKQPEFYKRWFPDQSVAINITDSTILKTDSPIVHRVRSQNTGVSTETFSIEPSVLRNLIVKQFEDSLSKNYTQNSINRIHFQVDSAKIEELGIDSYRYNYHGKISVQVNGKHCYLSQNEITISPEINRVALYSHLNEELNRIVELEIKSICNSIRKCLK